MIQNQLTKVEATSLAECEKIISRTKRSFVECGKALEKVRDQKLYRQDYGTFDNYCEKRWGWGRSYADRLIIAATLPINDAHGRQNSSKSNGENAPKSAPATERAARAARSQEIKQLAEEKTIDVDMIGHPIPEKAIQYWDRLDEAKSILKLISTARAAVRELKSNSDKDPMYSEVNLSSVSADLNNAYTTFSQSIPYAVCTTCQGITPETCTFCKGRGLISKFKYDTCVPEELKAIRGKK